MKFAQSFLMCFGMLLIAASIVLTPKTAYAFGVADCVSGKCGDCDGKSKTDSCNKTGPGTCACECKGKSSALKCKE